MEEGSEPTVRLSGGTIAPDTDLSLLVEDRESGKALDARPAWL